MKIEMSEVINHPISDVFKFYADDHLENHSRWELEMQLSLATDGEVGIGTVSTVVTPISVILWKGR